MTKRDHLLRGEGPMTRRDLLLGVVRFVAFFALGVLLGLVVAYFSGRWS